MQGQSLIARTSKKQRRRIVRLYLVADDHCADDEGDHGEQ
jgi:hypothetical protein